MKKIHSLNYSLIIAILFALSVFGIAMAASPAEGGNEPNSPDCTTKIKIIKVTNPISDNLFDFNITKSGISGIWESFKLNGTGQNSKEYNNIDYDRTYTISETIDPNNSWALTGISCTVTDQYNKPKTDVPITKVIAADGKSGYASFYLKDYRFVTCTFNNDSPQSYDFGDLPEVETSSTPAYGITSLANNGARHVPGNIYLGSGVDIESDGLASQYADGDDGYGNDDEDGGIRASSPNKWIGGFGAVDVTVTGGPACLSAWMDVYNSDTSDLGADGDFNDSGVNGAGNAWSENVINNVPLSAGTHNLQFYLPDQAATYNVYARFRLLADADGDGDCTDQAAPQLTGLIANGEVEDYMFEFDPTAISLQNFSASPFKDRTMLLIPTILGVGLLGVFFSIRKKS